MYKISKDFTFHAAHVLEGLPGKHQCSRMHGHEYVIRVELRSDTLDSTGFVVDYGDLSPIKKFINDKLDHKFLALSLDQAQKYNLSNDEFTIIGMQTSAENLARYIHSMFIERFPTLYKVSVSETSKTWAAYTDNASNNN